MLIVSVFGGSLKFVVPRQACTKAPYVMQVTRNILENGRICSGRREHSSVNESYGRRTERDFVPLGKLRQKSPGPASV